MSVEPPGDDAVKLPIVPYPAHNVVILFSLDSLTFSVGSRPRTDLISSTFKAVLRFILLVRLFGSGGC